MKPIGRVVLVVAALWLVRAAACPARAEVQLATFNIELFLQDRTDLSRVAETIAEADADIMAVQEIRDPLMMQLVLARASERTGRDLVLVSADCGRGSWFATGIVYDAASWRLVESREYPALDPRRREECTRGWASGLLGVFENAGGERIAALSVHLRAKPDGYPIRREQWARALTIARDVEDELGVTTLVLGDMNSTGFTDTPREEREFVRGIVARHGFDLLTDDLPCSEYWPRTPAEFSPSVLDHVVATGGTWAEPVVGGYCARLACKRVPSDRMDPDFRRVSDHCPVTVRGTLD